MSKNSAKFVGEGLTYDDVLLVPAYSETLPREVSLKSLFTKRMTKSKIKIALMTSFARTLPDPFVTKVDFCRPLRR